MTSQRHSSQNEVERRFLERLRTGYEDEGYTFEPYPDAARLPEFLRSYIPDALASKQGRNIAIEVKQRPSASTEVSLKEIRRLFEGHPDWHFRVVFMGSDPFQSVAIPAAKPATVRSSLSNVRTLMTQGHHRAAFVLAWSLLEAALGALDSEATSRPRTPGTVVQTLATNGFIEPDLERRLRGLIELRDRIVHGDLEADPSPADVEAVLSGVDEALGTRSA